MFDLSKLSEEQRDEVAQRLCREIDASEAAKGDLPRRWKRNLDLYHVVPGITNLNIVEGMEGYTIPLWRQKADRIIGNVVSSITGIYPYVQVIEEGAEGTNDENLERALMAIAERAEFKRLFRQGVRLGLNTNIGILRFRPKVKRHKDAPESYVEDSGESYVEGDNEGEASYVGGVEGDNEGEASYVGGVEGDWIDPVDFVAYPSYGTLDDAKTLGHRFYTQQYRVQALMDDGTYFKADVVGGDDPKANDNHSSRWDKTESTSPVSEEDGMVALYELITECDLGHGYCRYLCVVAATSQKLLSIQEYPYENQWYVDVRADDDGGMQIWPNDSPAQTMQGLGLAYNDVWTTMIHGSYMGAFPPVVMTGGVSELKAKRYGPGQVWEVPVDVQVHGIPIQFNPGALPAAGEKFEEISDALTGISRLGTGQNLPSGTTATAAQGFLQGQEEAKTQYTEAFSPAVKKSFALFLMFLRAHFTDLKKVFGTAIPLNGADEISSNVRLSVTGENSASSPNALMQKLQFALSMASDPTSEYDVNAIRDRIMQTLDLPFNTQGLKKTPDTQLLAQLKTLTAQGLNPMQLIQAGMQAMQSGAAQSQHQQMRELMNYKDMPEDIKRQMEAEAGFQPSQVHPVIDSMIKKGQLGQQLQQHIAPPVAPPMPPNQGAPMPGPGTTNVNVQPEQGLL